MLPEQDDTGLNLECKLEPGRQNTWQCLQSLWKVGCIGCQLILLQVFSFLVHEAIAHDGGLMDTQPAFQHLH